MHRLTASWKPRRPFFYEPPVALGAVDVAPGVRILAHSYINGGRVSSGIYIGRYCSIGNGVTLGTGHHDLSLLSTSSWFDSDAPPSVRYAEPGVIVRIKHDVWIGDNVIVMNGVTIGTGAVIGAGAVVTKDVLDYAVVGGVPAKVLKHRFPQAIVERLLHLRWWELDDEVLKQHRLSNINDSLAFLEGLGAEHRTMVSERVVQLT